VDATLAIQVQETAVIAVVAFVEFSRFSALEVCVDALGYSGGAANTRNRIGEH